MSIPEQPQTLKALKAEIKRLEKEEKESNDECYKIYRIAHELRGDSEKISSNRRQAQDNLELFLKSQDPPYSGLSDSGLVRLWKKNHRPGTAPTSNAIVDEMIRRMIKQKE